MSAPTLDLVYELTQEFGWDSSFATAAKQEYVRWLTLRAKTHDFESCNLPPSRVVAMVWNLHRQWTLDYSRLCDSLGGFIHHYPPSMRVNVAMEQAYNMTLQMYKNEYKEHAPTEYWGPSICTITSAQPIDTSGPFRTEKGAAPLPSPRTPRALRGKKRPTKPSKPDGKPGTHASPPDAVGATTHTPRTSPKAVARGARIDNNLVLRPLSPGQKRRRGRPSATEYMPVAQLSTVVTKPASGKGSGRVGRPRRVKTAPKVTDTVDRVITSVVAARPAAIAPRPAGSAAVPADGCVRRPRGRPRKDGSWPKSRVLPDVPGGKAPEGRLAPVVEAAMAAVAATQEREVQAVVVAERMHEAPAVGQTPELEAVAVQSDAPMSELMNPALPIPGVPDLMQTSNM